LSARQKAIILIFLTALLWSLGGVLIKSIPLNPIAIAGSRSLISAIFLLLFLRDFRTGNLRYVIAGAFCYAATVILFVAANKLTTAANAILLQYSAPIWVALIGAWFLKEKVKLTDWLFIFTMIGGIMLFFLDELTFSGRWGNILAILGGVAFAGTVLHMRKLKDSSPLLMIVLGNLLTAAVCLPFFPTTARFGEHLWLLLALGIFQLGLPYILYSIAIKSVHAVEATLISGIEAILNPLWVFIMLSERPGFWSIIGGIIVFCTVTAYGVIAGLREKNRLTFGTNNNEN